MKWRGRPTKGRATDIHLHGDVVVNVQGNTDLQEEILTKIETIGAQMSALSDAVDALQGRISQDVDHLLQLLAEANQRAADAAANDAADTQAIADLTAANQAATDDANATAARINAIDPVADFPAVEEPPVEEPPPVEPPVEEPNP